MSADNGYENKARRIARQIGVRVSVRDGDGRCPKWRAPCDHMHGNHYRVTLYHHGSLSFDFWGSLHDKEHDKRPTYYDILACVSSDASMPTDPDLVVEELGAMRPSQAIATARFAKRLRTFFTEGELRQLSEIP